MRLKPRFTRCGSGGPSYDAWLYELAAIHHKLDYLRQAINAAPYPVPDEGRLHEDYNPEAGQ